MIDLKKHIFVFFTIILFSQIIISQIINPIVFPKGELTLYQDDKYITIPIEIADTEELRSLGLMYREDIPQDYGMLFIFPTPGIRSFWMKNTYIPLDIAFIDSEERIIDILTMEPCINDPCPTYMIYKPFKYALEVKSGFFERYGFSEGAKIKWMKSE